MKFRSGLIFVAVLALSGPAFGWGADGHRMIDAVAMKALPAELPAFLRTPQAAQIVGYLGPEADRQKGAGETRDKAMDPGHYLDLSDDMTVLGGPKLDALPPLREDYDSALRKADKTQYAAGYLPYSIVEGYQLLVKDFAYYRAYAAGERLAKTDDARKAYAALRAMREAIVLRDLGYWSHFIGDGSQPLHVTVHFNGWGDYPNPDHFTLAKIHGPWETGIVRHYVTEEMVAAATPAPQALDAPIWAETERYLAGTNAAVVPLYRLFKKGAYPIDGQASAEGIAFTTAQIARGAAELRDLVVKAWHESATVTIGWPEIPISDIEAGKADPPPPYGG